MKTHIRETLTLQEDRESYPREVRYKLRLKNNRVIKNKVKWECFSKQITMYKACMQDKAQSKRENETAAPIKCTV